MTFPWFESEKKDSIHYNASDKIEDTNAGVPLLNSDNKKKIFDFRYLSKEELKQKQLKLIMCSLFGFSIFFFASLFSSECCGKLISNFNNYLNQPRQSFLVYSGNSDNNNLKYSCPIDNDTPESCKLDSSLDLNTCCFNTPGGLLLSTQFWDTNPAEGPNDLFTLHGLWPDNCDGSFDQFCDSSRSVQSIKEVLKLANRSDLIDRASQVWKDISGNDDQLWTHEWNKHGTCISTLHPTCYHSEAPSWAPIVDYFTATLDLFDSLDTYAALGAAGIIPHETRRYTYDQIQKALSWRNNTEVTLGCSSGALTEVWYYFHVRGSLQTGVFVPTNPDGPKSSCPQSGIRFLPKNYSPPSPSPNPSPSPIPIDPGKAFLGGGHILISSYSGCLISTGDWYSSGTCATYHGIPADSSSSDNSDGITLYSSKGNCAVIDSEFKCSRDIDAPTVFYVSDNKFLTFNSSSVWYASNVPRKFQKVKVSSQFSSSSITLNITWLPF